MAITSCHICDEEHKDQRRHDTSDYQDGIQCPLCLRPACRRHLSTVRWRWRTATRETDSAHICQTCRREYRHREWDTFNREWIT